MRHFGSLLLFAAVAAALLLSACSTGGSFPVRTYPMGEKVEIGHLIYTVFETQWLTQIGEGATARIPQHRFFVVRLSAVNSGSSESSVPTLTVEDDNGGKYTELSDGNGVSQWIGFLRQIRPAESTQGNVVFDAPPRHYKLRVTDEGMDRAALIDIPLSFGAETPEVPVPGGARSPAP